MCAIPGCYVCAIIIPEVALPGAREHLNYTDYPSVPKLLRNQFVFNFCDVNIVLRAGGGGLRLRRQKWILPAAHVARDQGTEIIQISYKNYGAQKVIPR